MFIFWLKQRSKLPTLGNYHLKYCDLGRSVIEFIVHEEQWTVHAIAVSQVFDGELSIGVCFSGQNSKGGNRKGKHAIYTGMIFRLNRAPSNEI